MAESKWGFWAAVVTAVAGLAGVIYQTNVAKVKTEESKESAQQSEQYQQSLAELKNRYNKLKEDCERSSEKKNTGFNKLDEVTFNAPDSVRMDLWVLQTSDDVNTFVVKQEQEKIPPFGFTKDNSNIFGYANFRIEREFRSLNKKPFAFKWSGLVEIKENGQYLFTNQIKIKPIINGNGWGYFVYSKLKIGNLEIDNLAGRMRQGTESQIQSKFAYLRPGKHPFEIWLIVNWVQYNGYMSQYEFNPDAVEIVVNERGPSDKVPHALSPKTLNNSESTL